jgi:hypothetical protein
MFGVEDMPVNFSRRGFLGGLLASASVAALPFPEVTSPVVHGVESLAGVVPPAPFHFIYDGIAYYMTDF